MDGMGLLAHVVSILTYKKLTDCFPLWHSVLHSRQQCVRVVGAVSPHHHLDIVILFLILTILVSMQWYLIVGLIYIFLMTNNVEREVQFLYLNFSYNVHVFLFVCLLHLLFHSFKKHCRWSETVVLQVWFLHQQHYHHLETYWKCRFSGATPNLLNPRLWEWGWILTSPPGDSLVHQSLKIWKPLVYNSGWYSLITGYQCQHKP